MPTRRVLVLAFVCLLLFAGCPTDSGSDETSEEDEVEVEPAPEEEAEPPEENAQDGPAYEEVERFDDDPADSCGSQVGQGFEAAPCTGEFDACSGGLVGTLYAAQCPADIEAPEGTNVSLDVRIEATAAGVNTLWACSGEPTLGTSQCVFDLSEAGQSLVDGPCDFDGQFTGDDPPALILVVPTTCNPVPPEVAARLTSATDFNGQVSAAAAFLSDDDVAVFARFGALQPLTPDDLVPLLGLD